MRQGPNSRRTRGRNNNSNRRSNLPNRNQTFDSNGPEVRIRGNAYQVHEKYLALARDSFASGDRVMSENYLQHAEHYCRIINAMNDAYREAQQQQFEPREHRDNGNREQGWKGSQGRDAGNRDDTSAELVARDGNGRDRNGHDTAADGAADQAGRENGSWRDGANGEAQAADRPLEGDPRDEGDPDFGADPRRDDGRGDGNGADVSASSNGADATPPADNGAAEAAEAEPARPVRRRRPGRPRRTANAAATSQGSAEASESGSESSGEEFPTTNN